MAKTSKKRADASDSPVGPRGKKDGRGVAGWLTAAQLHGFGETLVEIGKGLEEAAAWMNGRELPRLYVDNQGMFREAMDRVGTFLENVTRARRAATMNEPTALPNDSHPAV